MNTRKTYWRNVSSWIIALGIACALSGCGSSPEATTELDESQATPIAEIFESKDNFQGKTVITTGKFKSKTASGGLLWNSEETQYIILKFDPQKYQLSKGDTIAAQGKLSAQGDYVTLKVDAIKRLE